MNDKTKSLMIGCGLAIVSTALATWLRLLVGPYVTQQVPFLTFFLAVIVTAWYGNLGATLLAVLLSGLAVTHFFIPPEDSLLPQDAAGWIGLSFFAVFGVATALFSEWMWRRSEEVQQERERIAVTLSSIGDGVVVTDERARVTFLNSVAEELTGWSLGDAQDRPLETVFEIVHEQTREKVENPVAKALHLGQVVGLANHTILIAKDGSERAIDDTAAPIRKANGNLIGAVLVFRDVSRQRAAQIATGRLAALVDSSEDAILGQTFEAVITDWNAGAERLFGYSAEETVGRPSSETIVPPDREQELLEVLERVRQGERVEQFETVRQCKGGELIPVDVRISPIRDAEGKVIAASAIDRDISPQKAAEKRRNARIAVTQILALEQDEANAIREILAAVCRALEWDAGCYWRFRSDENALRCEEFWGEPSRNLEEFRRETLQLALSQGMSLPGRAWQKRGPLWVPDVVTDPGFLRAPQAKEVGLHGAIVCPIAVGDNFLGAVEWYSREIQQPDEDLLEMLATIGGQIGHFIERKAAEKAVNESERLYRAIGESIDYGVWVCDSDGRNIYVSDSFLELVGLTQAECSEFGWGSVVHPDEVDETIAAWKECVRTGGNWDREHRFFGVDGAYHPTLARGVPVKDDDGRVMCWAGINLDISRIKQVEDDLREADRRKDEFLAMLAHELRNPLVPIRSGLDILAMDAGSHQETVVVMQEQVEHVVRLVDDLLDVSRIMRGKIELRSEPVELGSLVERSVKAVQPMVDAHRQELHVSLPEQPILLNADPVRIVQVLENLLNNASKYTEAGGRIEVTLERETAQAVVSVRDTGVGIEPELLPKVFELFTQSTRSLDRAQGGLGIGLTLVRRLVELHEGSVSVDSDGPGQGSTFTVRLPIATTAPPSAEKENEPSPSVRVRRILVVDDNVGAAYLVRKLLERLDDHEIETAHDGLSALEKIKAIHPEIVFLDIGLPGMDGFHVAREVRQHSEFDDVLLVALTGYGQQEDRQKAEDAGFDAHRVKPPSVDQIREILNHPKLSTTVPPNRASRPQPPRPLPSNAPSVQAGNGNGQPEENQVREAPASTVAQMKHDILNTVHVLKIVDQMLARSKPDPDAIRMIREGLRREEEKLNRIADRVGDIA